MSVFLHPDQCLVSFIQTNVSLSLIQTNVSLSLIQTNVSLSLIQTNGSPRPTTRPWRASIARTSSRWRLQRGQGIAAMAADEGWSSPEVFSRAFRRAYGVPPSQAVDVDFSLSVRPRARA
jgi:methylphosphotriester-DNA--protein-cysteine methyltransferase